MEYVASGSDLFPYCPIAVNTQYRVNAKWTENVMNWEDCSKLCRERDGCQYWTWHKKGSGSWEFKCVTMTDANSKTDDSNTISGYRNCRGGGTEYVRTIIEPGGYFNKHRDKGYWGLWKHCSEGHHVMGMRLKIEPSQGRGDDTALNAIRLTCTDGEELVSAEKQWGDPQEYTQSADRTIVGVQLRSEPHLGPDDTSANGIRFKDGEGNTYSPGDGYWGDWGDWASCPAGAVIVGFRTYVVPNLGSGDDTALERVQFKCTNYDDHYKTSTPGK